MSRRLLLAALTLLLGSGGALGQDVSVEERLAAYGCVVGPRHSMGVEPPSSELHAKLQSYANAALDRGQAERQGDWIVLGPDHCTIIPPVIETTYDIESPLVQRHVSDIDAYAEFGEHGCFIASEGIEKDLVALEGLTPAEATLAYLRMIAQGVESGRVTFFSDDPLRTPSGFQVLTGACAEVPQIDAMRRSQELMLEHFDMVVRENAKRVACAPNVNSVTMEIAQVLSDATGGASENEWTIMDFLLLSIGAGWVEGVTATQRGTPRPPICSYAE